MKILITDKQLVSLTEQLSTLKKLLQVSKEAKPITKAPQAVKSFAKDIQMFNLNKIRKPNGSIGNQGATVEGINDILKSIGINIKFKIPNKVTFKEITDHLKNDPKEMTKFKEFLKKEPIIVSELPGGEYALKDGHHRATLAYHLGVEEIPAIIKK